MDNKKKSPIKTKQNIERDPRHLKFKTLSTTLTVAVIIAIILLNVIVSAVAERYPLTIDMSSDKIFTLSEDSKKFANSVTTEVEVVVLADPEELFNQFASIIQSQTNIDFSLELQRISREITTALEELRKHSNSKITFTMINPDQEPEKYAKYADYNLGSEYDILFISGERFKKDALASMITLTDNMQGVESKVEYVLISNISALQGDSNRVIQVLTGHNENTATMNGLEVLYEVNGYIFEKLDITGSTEFNDDAEVLLIAAPKSDYTTEEVRRITDWLNNDTKRNRHLIVFVDPDTPIDQYPNLYGMLKTDYHIEVTDHLIYETDKERYFSDGTSYDPHYVWANVDSNKYTTSAYNAGGMVKTPNARLLRCDLPYASTGTGIEELGLRLTIHPESARVTTLGSDEKPQEPKDDEFPLVSGISYVFEATDNNEFKAATTTVTVLGSSAMAYNMYTQDYSTQNEELLLGLIHSITNYQTNITISNKVVAKDTIQFKDGTDIRLGIWVFTIGVPVVVLTICLVVFLRRRSL